MKKAVFWFTLLLVAILSLSPPAYLPSPVFSLWDKAQHAAAFAALAFLGLQAHTSRVRWQLVIALLALGGAIELAQASTGWRYGEWLDWMADAVGIAIGMGTSRLLTQRGILARFSGN